MNIIVKSLPTLELYHLVAARIARYNLNCKFILPGLEAAPIDACAAFMYQSSDLPRLPRQEGKRPRSIRRETPEQNTDLISA